MKSKSIVAGFFLCAVASSALACGSSSGPFGNSFAKADSYTDCFIFTLASDAKSVLGTLGKVDTLGNKLNIRVKSVSLYSDAGLLKTDKSPVAFSFNKLVGGSVYTLQIVSDVKDARGRNDGKVGYAGVITNVAAAVPEPSAYALAIAGFLAVGAGVWRRRRN